MQFFPLFGGILHHTITPNVNGEFFFFFRCWWWHITPHTITTYEISRFYYITIPYMTKAI